MSVIFQDIVKFYRKSEFNANSDSGFFVPETQEDLILVRNLINEENDDSGITFDEISLAEVCVGVKFKFNLIPPRVGIGNIWDTVEKLWNLFPKDEPENYYIRSIDFYSNDTEIPVQIVKYRTIQKFLTFLKGLATYFDPTSKKLIFVVDSTVSSINLSSAQLDSEIIDSINIQEFEELLNIIQTDDSYQKNKREILTKVIGDTVTSKDANINDFIYLLKNINLVLVEFKKRFEVFLANFSYDKIIDQLRTVQIEETGKIHKVFSDIQNQVLAIPIASLISISQMKDLAIPAINVEFAKISNLCIVVGVTIFIAMVWFLLSNQFLSLKTIKTELESRESKFKQDPRFHALIEDSKINSIFSDISKRLRIQKYILILVSLLSIICLLASWVYFVYINHPHIWLKLVAVISRIFSL